MKVAEELVALLIGRRETVATAESCTGGLVAAALTDIPGVSECYPGGIVSYANEVKHRDLGVPNEILKTKGAVSAECAEAMAVGVRARFGTDWGVVTTGIAGPGGGTPEKPVGLVYVGVAGPDGAEVSRNVFSGDRAAIRAATVQRALSQLLERIRAATHIPRGRDEARPSQDLPIRHCPSRNSIHVGDDNRATILFVSVNATKRQRVFDNPAAVSCILSAWNDAKDWLVGRYVIMPDHVHFCCAPAKWPIPDFHKWMTFWKTKVALSFPTEHVRPLWQRQCWDTQLRQGESFEEKCRYMVNNPVRKGLVSKAEDWPYQGVLNVFDWHEK